MSRHARQPLPGLDRSQAPVRETGATLRSGQFTADGERGGKRAAAAAVPGPRTAARRARKARSAARAGTVALVTYLAVVVCAAAGVYISWRQGSNGGGRGGVVAGAALLAAAVARLMLPGNLAGLLASRRRATDVLTLTVFGTGLLITGLVLPRLGSLSVQGRMPARR